ncbi:Glutaredoxin [hydrothermal vent metagenome]|uniref:Glutaredoxin n=1 Tax=hydrothermal vent metagenome TaxID=652676 RepID=A0A3B0WR83_9ZZZZ
MLLKILRNGLGYLVILISKFIPIKKQIRSSEEQNCVNNATRTLTLYQFYACPFCLKTRRAFTRLGLHIHTRDATKNPARAELLAGGGQIKVPCLKIENKGVVVWMYESTEIIEYLERHFGESSAPCSELNY